MKFLSTSTGLSSKLLGTVLTLALTVASLAAVGTNALFTETDEVGSNTFSTGSVDIATTPASALVSYSTMAPGDATTGKMVIDNTGSLELRYAVTSTTDEDTLAAQLDMTIWDEAEEATVDGTCADTAPTTVLYDTAVLGSTAGTDVIGDPTTGNQTGDRTVAAGGSETLCFHVALPSSTDSTYEGLTSTSTLAFQAEQTANNA